MTSPGCATPAARCNRPLAFRDAKLRKLVKRWLEDRL